MITEYLRKRHFAVHMVTHTFAMGSDVNSVQAAHLAAVELSETSKKASVSPHLTASVQLEASSTESLEILCKKTMMKKLSSS